MGNLTGNMTDNVASQTDKLPDGYITPNFSFAELVKSATAKRLGIDNTPNDVHKNNLIVSVIHLFQPVRELLGVPVLINSGYRSATVNKMVGGSPTSAHCMGFAIDFVAPKFGNTRQITNFLATELVARGIGFDQIILEFPDSANSWIHLGYKDRHGRQRGQLLTATKQGGKTVYLQGLR